MAPLYLKGSKPNLTATILLHILLHGQTILYIDLNLVDWKVWLAGTYRLNPTPNRWFYFIKIAIFATKFGQVAEDEHPHKFQTIKIEDMYIYF